MNKFTQFLDDEKRTPTGIDVQRAFAPKEYHTTRKIKIERITLVIVIFILMIALASALVYPLFIKDTDTSKSIDEPMVLESNPEPFADPQPEVVQIADKPNDVLMPVCNTTSTFKSWMDYRMITSKSSGQWSLQQKATNDDNGFRKVDKYYTVAMASQYGPVGTKYLITFSGGTLIYVMIGDIKANTNCSHDDSSMLEFIIDKDIMPKENKRSGNFNSIFEGTITEIKLVD